MRGFAESVLSLVPAGFSECMRIFHPAYRTCGMSGEVKWAEIARANGMRMHAGVQLGSITGSERYEWEGQPGVFDQPPEAGNLPRELLDALPRVLAGRTSTPDTCYFAVWEGMGLLPPEVRAAPTFSVPSRTYHLLTGPVDAVGELADAWQPPRSPNLWWPRDHAWCVATEVDLKTTYIAADRPYGPADHTAARAVARERELLRRIHEHGDIRARHQLAEQMLPLARALARRYANRGEALDDLVQVVCIGVMKAIDGFDLAREARFSSYATPTVLGEIKRHFRDKTSAVRVPRPLQELQVRVAQARDDLTHELGNSPTVQEIAAAVQAPFVDVLAAIQSASARRTRSLDETNGEDVTLADSLGSVDPEIERAEQRALIDSAFHVLSERDQEVLRLRFHDDLSQAEIAQRIGVSQMEVSRLIQQSLARLRLRLEHSPDRTPTNTARPIPNSHFQRPPADDGRRSQRVNDVLSVSL